MEACVRSCIRCMRVLTPINAIGVSVYGVCLSVWVCDSFQIELCLLTNINKHIQHRVHRMYWHRCRLHVFCCVPCIIEHSRMHFNFRRSTDQSKNIRRTFRHVIRLTSIAFFPLMYRVCLLFKMFGCFTRILIWMSSMSWVWMPECL